MSKDVLEIWLKELDANQSFKLTDYIED